MEGIQFVRESHMPIAEGCFLPRADLLGFIQSRLHEIVYKYPELRQYVPNLLEVDLFIGWDEDRFLLLVSPEKRAQLPTRGMETNHLSLLRKAAQGPIHFVNDFLDISNHDIVKKAFEQIGFKAGFAAEGNFPASSYTEEAKVAKAKAGEEVARLIQNWAQARQRDVENSRIFLSHKGINKPLVEKIDRALRLLNLKTWFDSDDLLAGDALVRGVDNAFAGCAAAVFFISSDYLDAGVISKEIDRAVHEAAMRPESFRIIPLVLTQHGGSDQHVPSLLQTQVWKTVGDVEIVPTILRALPVSMQKLIRYEPLK